MGKFRLFAAAIDSGHIWLAVFGVLNSVLSIYYYLRIVTFMYQRSDTFGSRSCSRLRPATSGTVSMSNTSVGAIGISPSTERAGTMRNTLLCLPTSRDFGPLRSCNGPKSRDLFDPKFFADSVNT
jgi:NADH-quinone oxidoreductase subunit N